MLMRDKPRGEEHRDRIAVHLARGSLVSMSVRVVGLGLAFLSHLALSRALGASQYGQYVIALGWAMVLVIPSRLGLDNSVLRFATIYRELGRTADLRGLLLYSFGLILAVSLAIAASLMIGKFAGIQPLGPIDWQLIAGIALIIPSLAILGWLSAFIRTANRIFASQFYEQVLRPALLVIAIVLAVLAGRTPNAGQAMLLTAATIVIAALGIALHAVRAFSGLPSSEASFERSREWLLVSWPLLLMAGVQELLNQIDLILLGLLSNNAQAAHFAAAWRLASLVAFGLVAIATVSGPMIASAHNRKDMVELARIAKLGARFSTIFALAAAALLAMIGKFALGLFGTGFDAAYPALVILLLGGLANSFTGSVGYLLTMTGNERAALHILAGGLLVSLVANLLLIPAYGATGAAIASALGVTSWNVAMVIFMQRKFGIDATAIGRRARDR